MSLPFEFSIGLRYLRSKRKQMFLSLITFISLGGITLGVASLIIVLSVMDGFQKDLREKILGIRPHIMLFEKYGLGGIPDYEKEIANIKDIKGITAVSPFILSQSMLKVRGTTEGAMIFGISPEKENLIPNVSEQASKLVSTNGKPGILMGNELALRLGAITNDEIILVTPIFKNTPLGMIPKVGKFEVVGTFKSGMYEYDSTFAYISLVDAQQLYEMPGKVSNIEVRIKDVYGIAPIEKEIKNKVSGNIRVENWMQMNRNLFSALRLEKTLMTIMLALIILVAVFNILGGLIMMVMKKTKEIGVLRSLGASSKSIMRIFIYQGMSIGVFGTVIGLILGVGTSVALKHYQFIKLSSDVYYIDYLPVELKFLNIILVVAVSLILSFISTIYPARQAAKLDPVEAIRYE